ncbi:AbrB/MazE/SpoVT family DNA-binding domain-containing protein [Halococcoides cellulosivorans]|uniref:AbrB family transcriptional regulator n=1 Tax=Halococcoides cellulosivorans TaxID=1679096 RepID=A0A2R4X4J3_9EURY|nr:AbrB family transcriptional regulator [Halococcoides cellulosivorans]AWB28714.1 AbrB family transcriptional regulator [Halococcoides cellulosivorans]
MARVTTTGTVTIPTPVHEELGTTAGDEVAFESTPDGYVIRPVSPRTPDGEDPFEIYRGVVEGTMSDRMRRLRGDQEVEHSDETDSDK